MTRKFLDKIVEVMQRYGEYSGGGNLGKELCKKYCFTP
jgi:hypothetical protein